MTKHKFAVGQTVELVACSRRHVLGVYQIVALLPVEHGEPQYRIKSLTEAHAWRAVESELRAVTANS
jgi:hypothetical protein